MNESTKEPQYNRCLELREEIGLVSLGLMTNQVWHDDPRRLAILLSRYKFVAKMLSGRGCVAELGCGDAFGTRIVQQETKKVTVYDFDKLFIEDIRARQSKRWPLEAHVHDILTGPLPKKYDAIYSLDVLEHIELANEAVYLGNLGKSLADHGVLIVGSPSLESQAYASPTSKAGHVNCKSGNDFKAVLERHFHTVFVFSMNDEVVHTGFCPMAHYLFGLCCERRE
jgi:2-polyprenyl-3-methyl-5-hydroxy-6-metoxy-1,4-benzoquinol methylase